MPNAVVIDANILISICTKEQDTYPEAEAAFNLYAQNGCEIMSFDRGLKNQITNAIPTLTLNLLTV